jgi:cytidylate kinase
MYRGVTLAVIEAGAAVDDADACAEVARRIELAVDDGTTTIDGRDVSELIRGPEVTQLVSTVAAHPAVREVLVACQRDWVRQRGGGVVEGRDIGTVVFPDAPVKVFLTASGDERARRRQLDEQAAARDVGVDDVRADLARRDAIDSGRVASPLRPAEDAIVIDTTSTSVDKVVDDIVARVRKAEAS